MSAQPPVYGGPGSGGEPPQYDAPTPDPRGAPAPGGYPGGPAPGYAVPPPSPPAPPPSRSNCVWWFVGGGIAGVALLCCVGVVAFRALLGGGAFAAFRVTAGPRNATTGYYEAVKAQDWAQAHSYLSAPLRQTTTQAALQANWQLRERTSGRIDRFSVTNTNITNNTATVTGTLRYQSGREEPRTVLLIKEGGDWKISTSP